MSLSQGESGLKKIHSRLTTLVFKKNLKLDLFRKKFEKNIGFAKTNKNLEVSLREEENVRQSHVILGCS